MYNYSTCSHLLLRDSIQLLGIESYAAEVKVPLIFDNSLSCFLCYCYCYIFFLVKCFAPIQISDRNEVG